MACARFPSKTCMLALMLAAFAAAEEIGAPAQTCGELKAGYKAAACCNQSKATKIPSKLVKVCGAWPAGFSGLGDAAEGAMQMISELSQGSLQFNYTPTYYTTIFNATRTGECDAYIAADYYFMDEDPPASKALAFFTSVPFGMTATEQSAWMYAGGGQELYQQLLDRYGLIGFLHGSTGLQSGYWAKFAINSLEDVVNKTLRIPGMGGQVWKKL